MDGVSGGGHGWGPPQQPAQGAGGDPGVQAFRMGNLAQPSLFNSKRAPPFPAAVLPGGASGPRAFTGWDAGGAVSGLKRPRPTDTPGTSVHLLQRPAQLPRLGDYAPPSLLSAIGAAGGGASGGGWQRPSLPPSTTQQALRQTGAAAQAPRPPALTHVPAPPSLDASGTGRLLPWHTAGAGQAPARPPPPPQPSSTSAPPPRPPAPLPAFGFVTSSVPITPAPVPAPAPVPPRPSMSGLSLPAFQFTGAGAAAAAAVAAAAAAAPAQAAAAPAQAAAAAAAPALPPMTWLSSSSSSTSASTAPASTSYHSYGAGGAQAAPSLAAAASSSAPPAKAAAARSSRFEGDDDDSDDAVLFISSSGATTRGPAASRSGGAGGASSSSRPSHSRGFAAPDDDDGDEAALKTTPSSSAPSSSGDDSLSPEQALVFRLAVEQGRSVFFTGAAGTGKSHLLRAIITALRAKYQARNEPDAVYVTAPTGMAAINIGGTTIHSFSGIGLGKAPARELAAKIGLHGNTPAAVRWKKASVLVIDEVSMLDAETFDKLEYIARKVRGKERPFGGLQLILAGDFFQLPPVGLAPLNESSGSSGGIAGFRGPGGGPSISAGGAKFAFDAECWSSVTHAQIVLTQVFRQRDSVFINLLNEARQGILSPASAEALRGAGATVAVMERRGYKPTRVFALNRDVDALNAAELAKCGGKVLSFQAMDDGQDDRALDALQKSCVAPAVLQLAVGAQVMLTKNLDPKGGLVNGTRGVVTGFESYHDELAPAAQRLRPIVQWERGPQQEPLTLPVSLATWSIEQGGRELACRTQLPLKLAYALTAHKAQGMTISLLEVSFDGVFEHGQAYVALSRAVALDRVRVLGLLKGNTFKAHPRVIEFYKSLSSAAAAAAASGGGAGEEAVPRPLPPPPPLPRPAAPPVPARAPAPAPAPASTTTRYVAQPIPAPAPAPLPAPPVLPPRAPVVDAGEVDIDDDEDDDEPALLPLPPRKQKEEAEEDKRGYGALLQAPAAVVTKAFRPPAPLPKP